MENFTTEESFITEQSGSQSTAYDYSEYYGSDLNGTGPCEYGSHGSYFLPVLYSLFFVVGFLGNSLVVWVIVMSAQLKSMTDVCLLNLAIADLLLIFSLPFLAHHARDEWIFGNFMCSLVLSVYHIGFYGGIFFIVLMSIDRYLAVVHAVYALRIRTRVYGFGASMLIWLVAVSVCFPELTYLQTYIFNNETLCSSYPQNDSNKDVRATSCFKMNILGLLVPLLIIGFCYTMVLERLVTIRSSRRQAMRLIILAMVVFFLCWTPYNIVAFIKGLELKSIITIQCEGSKALRLIIQTTEALAYSHSCINPFLYVFAGEKFKRHLIRLLRGTPVFKLQFMKAYLTQATGSVYSQTTSMEERSAAL